MTTMRHRLLTLYLLTGFAILEGCASWRVNSFIVDHERTVVPASDQRGGQFLSDLVAVDSGARAALGTQGRPDYMFVERQSVFGSSVIKLAYIGDDRLVVLKRFANNSTVSIESGIPAEVAGLFTRDDRDRLARVRGVSPVARPPTASGATSRGVTASDVATVAPYAEARPSPTALPILAPTPTSALVEAPTATRTHTPEPTATPEKNYQLPFSVGNWKVELSTDPMTDKRVCTGFYGKRRDVQLNQGHLFVSLRGRGGVSSVTIRFDDDAPLSMRSAGTVEKDLSMVDIEGAEFSRLLGARRLRLQIFTILNTLVNEDLDLTGLPTAYDVICSEPCR